jgi:hypothetical protein
MMGVVWVLGFSAYGQPLVNPNPIKETFTGKVKKVTSASYECAGDSLNPEKQNAKNEERFLHTRTYDANGVLTEISYLHPDNTLKYRTVFTRDSKNNVLLEENFMSTGFKTKSTERTYNKNGYMLSQIVKNEKGKIIERNTYAYQDTARTLECFMSGDSVCTRKVESKRDKKGRLLEQTWYDSDCKTAVSKVVVQYDKKNNMTGSKTTTPDGMLVARRVFTYDPKGRLQSRTDFDANNTMLKRMEYIYDEKGKIRQESEIGKGGQLIMKGLYSYDSLGRTDWDYHFSSVRDMDVYNYFTYDTKGNIIARKQVKSNTQPQRDYVVYVYDKEGNWTQRTIYRGSRPIQIDERTITYY